MPTDVANLHTETMTINMGPQHPSTHGVLRLVLELDGETVVRCTPVVGYLHTGMEKQGESKNYSKFIPTTDRMDYLAAISNNLGFCLAVEKLLGIEVPLRAQYIRVLLTEMTRISSHLVWLGTHAMDLGAQTVFLYCFREREKFQLLQEMICGARLTASFVRIGGVMLDLPDGFLEASREFVDQMPRHIAQYERLLTRNPIWLRRTQGVGVLTAEQCLALSVTGPMLRASGVKWDLRKARPYSSYEHFDFDVPTGTAGDVYERYLVRLEEMRQSVRICQQAIDRMPAGDYRARDSKYVLPPREDVHRSMEALIHHFRLVSEGFRPPVGEVYQAIEAPKGELGFYLVSDGGPNPYRVHVRGPSFVNLQSLPAMVEGRLVADVVAAIGSVDIVLGEVDR
ncbi:MAG TPA: NADH dehydrogenase (quinone) subunit D [Candidatus Saccharimonadales bacterium]|nr:NADH dehydrogenase (quinone) subunit D [Candidatus Saccharimonadales bacterium]